jgi:hypothetical protein
MAGGPTTLALVTAAGRAGGFGFLAAGYKTVDVFAAEVEEVGSTGLAYGVNVLVPGAIPDPRGIHRYRQELQLEYDRFGVEPPDLVLDDESGLASASASPSRPAGSTMCHRDGPRGSCGRLTRRIMRWPSSLPHDTLTGSRTPLCRTQLGVSNDVRL